jgi:hypothetical protein
MRLSTKRLAAPAAILAALAVAVPASSIAQPTGDDGASAAQKSRDRGPAGRDDKGGRTSPQCRGYERREEIAQANVSQAQAKLKTAKANLKAARAAAKATTPGTKAAKKAKAKVTKAKKKVKSAKAKLKSEKASLRSAKNQAEARGC